MTTEREERRDRILMIMMCVCVCVSGGLYICPSSRGEKRAAAEQKTRSSCCIYIAAPLGHMYVLVYVCLSWW